MRLMMIVAGAFAVLSSVQAGAGRPFDTALWSSCATNAEYSYGDSQDVTTVDTDCQDLPRWESETCIRSHVTSFCSRKAYAADPGACKDARMAQLCCYRTTRCEALKADGVNCDSFPGDLDTCLNACTAVKVTCRVNCKANHVIGAERTSCLHACRDAKYACRGDCKHCARCETSTNVCQGGSGITTAN